MRVCLREHECPAPHSQKHPLWAACWKNPCALFVWDDREPFTLDNADGGTFKSLANRGKWMSRRLCFALDPKCFDTIRCWDLKLGPGSVTVGSFDKIEKCFLKKTLQSVTSSVSRLSEYGLVTDTWCKSNSIRLQVTFLVTLEWLQYLNLQTSFPTLNCQHRVYYKNIYIYKMQNGDCPMRKCVSLQFLHCLRLWRDSPLKLFIRKRKHIFNEENNKKTVTEQLTVT